METFLLIFQSNMVGVFYVHTKNCNHFSRTFQGPPARNTISQIVQKCTFPVYSNKALRLELLLLHQLLYIFQFTCLELIVNYFFKIIIIIF